MKGSLRKFWDKEESLSTFLWILIVFVFVVGPLSHLDQRLRLLIVFSFGAVLISGIWATVESPRIACLAAILVFLSVGTTAAEYLLVDDLRLQLFSKICDIPAVCVFLYVVVKQTLKDGPSYGHRIKGAVATYLLMAVLCAQIYHFILLARPGAFSGVDPSDPFVSLIYFSFVTLTTVGYGDILPINVFARSLANAEALIGQLFPAIFIARLVSLEVESRKR